MTFSSSPVNRLMVGPTTASIAVPAGYAPENLIEHFLGFSSLLGMEWCQAMNTRSSFRPCPDPA